MNIAAPIYYPEGPLVIRDATHELLKSSIAEVDGRVFKARTLPTKDDLLPCISVAHGGETGRPNGDANVAAPKFICELKLVIAIVALANSDWVLDARISRLVEKVKIALFTDTKWLMLIEAIEGFAVTYHYPREEDVTLCEARLELTLIYRSDWPPFEAFDLTEIEGTVQKLTPTGDDIIVTIPVTPPSN